MTEIDLERALRRVRPLAAGEAAGLFGPGSLIWRVDRDKVTRSGMTKLTSDDLYQELTIRSCNTVRKLADMMRAS